MDKYKIGEVASFLGLSSEAIRHYEKAGIIQPHQDPATRYRYFDTWDINFLLDCHHLRSFGFPLNQVNNLINQADLSEMVQSYHHLLTQQLEQLTLLQSQLEQTSLCLEKLESIPQRLGSFTTTKSPSVFYQPFRTESNFFFDRCSGADWQFWNEKKFAARNTFLIPSKINDEDIEHYQWGYSTAAENRVLYQPEELERMQFIPSYRSIYTVFCAYEENTFLDCLKEQVLIPLQERGVEVLDTRFFGNLLTRVHKDGNMIRYFEVWVPIL